MEELKFDAPPPQSRRLQCQAVEHRWGGGAVIVEHVCWGLLCWEIANDEKSFVGKSVRVLGRVKKVYGRERKLYITINWFMTPLRSVKRMAWIMATKIPYLSLCDVQPTFQFKRACTHSLVSLCLLIPPPASVYLALLQLSVPRSTTIPQSEKYALRPRIVLQSEGIDFHLYRKCIILRRKFIAEQFGENANSRKDKTSDPNDENSSNSGKEPTTVAASFTPAENGAKRIKLSATDGK